MSADFQRLVRELRHVLLWPVQIEPGFSGSDRVAFRDVLAGTAGNFVGRGPWQPLADEFTADVGLFQERHYKEFVTFLPYVQRFLYGESRSVRRTPEDPPAEASVEVFRRQDMAQLRIQLSPESAPLMLEIAHIDLYLFGDLDVAVLNVELRATDLPLGEVLDLLHQFGRAYPTGWDAGGSGLRHVFKAEWLDHDGQVVVASDSANKKKYLDFACRHRAPAVVAHWDHLLKPLVLDHSDEPGRFRYRLIEYYRMPFMAFLAMDEPQTLEHDTFIRLAQVSQLRADDDIPAEMRLGFEARHCLDRYWVKGGKGAQSRFLLNGQSLLVVGDAHSPYFMDAEQGRLGQFRHQIFLLFLIAHMHRAALLSFSDYLSDTTNDLDVLSTASTRRFKSRIRMTHERFLRFTHRYWFDELSEHSLVQSLFQRTSAHLENQRHYQNVREELRDMSEYLEIEAQRRQSGTMMRLTVVTTFGLIGTVATGFLGMNLIAYADAPMVDRVLLFALVIGGSALLTLFAVSRSSRLAELLEVLSNERAGWHERLRAFTYPFRRRR